MRKLFLLPVLLLMIGVSAQEESESDTVELNETVMVGKYYKKYNVEETSATLRVETPLIKLHKM